jgi:hypothetical protein
MEKFAMTNSAFRNARNITARIVSSTLAAAVVLAGTAIGNPSEAGKASQKNAATINNGLVTSTFAGDQLNSAKKFGRGSQSNGFTLYNGIDRSSFLQTQENSRTGGKGPQSNTAHVAGGMVSSTVELDQLNKRTGVGPQRNTTTLDGTITSSTVTLSQGNFATSFGPGGVR